MHTKALNRMVRKEESFFQLKMEKGIFLQLQIEKRNPFTKYALFSKNLKTRGKNEHYRKTKLYNLC